MISIWFITIPTILTIVIILIIGRILFRRKEYKRKYRVSEEERRQWNIDLKEHKNRIFLEKKITCSRCGKLVSYTHRLERLCSNCYSKNLCPNCQNELKSPYTSCDLCGWEWKSKKEEEKEKRSRHIPKKVQREVWRRDQGKCVECGSKENLEFDHIIPFSKGGSNTARNIQLLCENCNRKKYNNI